MPVIFKANTDCRRPCFVQKHAQDASTKLINQATHIKIILLGDEFHPFG